jgi:hypothetical protein
LAEAAGERIGYACLGLMPTDFVATSFITPSFVTTVFVTTSFVATVFIPAIFMVATTLLAAVFGPKFRVLKLRGLKLPVLKLRVLNVGVIVLVVLVIAGGKIGDGKNVFGNLVDVRLAGVKLLVKGRGDGGGFRLRGAKIRQNGLLKETLAQGGGIVGHGFFLIESDLAGVGADETSIEDTAGKLVKVFFFKGAQHADADFRGVGDVIELEATLLALLAKFFSEDTHVRLL